MKITPPTIAPLPEATAAPRPHGIGKVAGAKGVTLEKIKATAKDFESQFISQMLGSMFATRDVQESLGGSEAEETYQSFMVTEYGKIISRAGGIGIADQITQSMLKLQEMEAPRAKPPVT